MITKLPIKNVRYKKCEIITVLYSIKIKFNITFSLTLVKDIFRNNLN